MSDTTSSSMLIQYYRQLMTYMSPPVAWEIPRLLTEGISFFFQTERNVTLELPFLVMSREFINKSNSRSYLINAKRFVYNYFHALFS